MSLLPQQSFSGNQAHGNSRQWNGNLYNFRNPAEEARRAAEAVKARRQQFLQALFYTDPEDDLTAAKSRANNGRTPGTCRWLLHTSEYAAWHDGLPGQLLLLVGEPGIGKTMMATFLVDTLKDKASASNSRFCWFFCDNTKAKQRTVTSIMRGILWQLASRSNSTCDALLELFSIKGPAMFEDLEALWRCLELAIINDESDGEFILLIDALDECEESSRHVLVARLSALLGRQSRSKHSGPRLLVTTRNISDIVMDFRNRVQGILLVRMDTAKINKDLEVFIDREVNAISFQWKDELLASKVKRILRERDGGTFLWVSFALVAISRVESGQVVSELDTFPHQLSKIYIHILSQIPVDHRLNAQCALKLLVGTDRPLTLDQISVMLHLLRTNSEPERHLPTDMQIDAAKDWYKSCAVLLRSDDSFPAPKVSFVHQSVKSFLVSTHISDDLEEYRISEAEAQAMISNCCTAYLKSSEIQAIAQDIARMRAMASTVRDREFTGLRRLLQNQYRSFFKPRELKTCILSQWAWDKVQGRQLVLLDHVRQTHFSDSSDFQLTMKPSNSDFEIHDLGELCCRAVEHDLSSVARVLQIWCHPFEYVHHLKLSMSIKVAAERQNREFVEAVVKPASFFWSEDGLIAATDVLLRLELEESTARDLLSDVVRSVAIQGKRSALHYAAERSIPWLLQRCVEMDDDVLAVDQYGKTALHYAAALCPRGSSSRASAIDCMDILLQADRSAMLIQDEGGKVPLHCAQNPDAVQLLLHAKGGDKCLYITDRAGRLPLHCAVKDHLRYDYKMFYALLRPKGARRTVHIADEAGMLPLHYVCLSDCNDYERKSMLELLLESEIDQATIYKSGLGGRLPLHFLVTNHSVRDCLAFLLDLDKTKSTLHTADNKGKLAIHRAANNRFDDMSYVMRRLVDADINKQTLTARDLEGMTPLAILEANLNLRIKDVMFYRNRYRAMIVWLKAQIRIAEERRNTRDAALLQLALYNQSEQYSPGEENQVMPLSPADSERECYLICAGPSNSAP